MSQSFSAISVQWRSASCFNTAILSTHKLHSGGNLKKCWKAMNRALLYYQWTVRLHHPTHDLFTHTHSRKCACVHTCTCMLACEKEKKKHKIYYKSLKCNILLTEQWNLSTWTANAFDYALGYFAARDVHVLFLT